MNYWMPVAFLVVGIILVVLEMLTLTFYLAALAFAALVTALYAWMIPGEWWQAGLVYALASVVSLPLAHALRKRMQGNRTDPLSDMDQGGIVTVTAVEGHHLKVSYRDSQWEAIWEGEGEPVVGKRAEIAARDGSRLRIKTIR